MVEKNFIIFDKSEMEIIAKGLVLLIKDNTGIANFNEVLSLLNKVNSQLDSLMAIEEKKNIYFLNEYLYNRVLHGMKIRINVDYEYVYLVYNNELVGIYEKDQSYSEDNKSYKAKRVWN